VREGSRAAGRCQRLIGRDLLGGSSSDPGPAPVDPMLKMFLPRGFVDPVHPKSGTMLLGHEGTRCPATDRELPEEDRTGDDHSGIDVPSLALTG
jgi:hypothetical protein